MSGQHTPGPWSVGKSHPRRVSRNGKLVCTAILANGGGPGKKDYDEAHANARLIAAAPEGFDLIEQLEESFTADGAYEQFLPAMRAYLAKARAAQGEQL
jgi:hypothetical protein